MLNSRLLELAFLGFEVQIVRLHTPQNLMDDLSMFDDVATEDEDVVEVHGDLAFHDEVLEDVVHKRREGARRVGQPKEHHSRFVEPSIGNKGSLVLASFLDTNIVVAPSNIKLGVVLCALQAINELRDQWERILILDRHFV